MGSGDAFGQATPQRLDGNLLNQRAERRGDLQRAIAHQIDRVALRAMQDHPAVKKHQSIMVGNNMSDMQFGRAAGIYTVLLTTTGVRVEMPHPLVDLQYDSLAEFAAAIPT